MPLTKTLPLKDDLPPWKTGYHYFRLWRVDGTWERLNTALRREGRQAHGRDPEPSAAIIDSPSVKTVAVGGPRGYDAGKKVKGRQRHILVDTLGLLLVVVVHVANIQDRDGARLVLDKACGFLPRLVLIWRMGTMRDSWWHGWQRRVTGSWKLSNDRITCKASR